MLDLSAHFKKSIELADRGLSRMSIAPPEYLPPGMSGKKVRALLNNLCSSPEVRYLEVGLWQGSTFFSALHGNNIRAVGIDNWTEFQGPREQFCQFLPPFVGKSRVSVYDRDCYTYFTDERFNVFFYDGGHSTLEHYRAIAHFGPMMDKEFILVVDDFKSPEVHEGTSLALTDLAYEPILEAMTEHHNEPDAEGWWNGLYCAVIRKP